MSELSRRDFVGTVAAALPVLATPATAAARVPARPADLARADALDALADVVLPAELGEAGVRAAVAGFRIWLAAYEPVAEANHGYGTGEIEYLPADPAPGWNAQLDALDVEATKRYGGPFASLDPDRRRALVEARLAPVRGDRLPVPHEAPHVALGLLAWWCATPAANDLAYRARIGRESCRPLAQTVDEPAAIAPGG